MCLEHGVRRDVQINGDNFVLRKAGSFLKVIVSPSMNEAFLPYSLLICTEEVDLSSPCSEAELWSHWVFMTASAQLRCISLSLELTDSNITVKTVLAVLV